MGTLQKPQLGQEVKPGHWSRRDLVLDLPMLAPGDLQDYTLNGNHGTNNGATWVGGPDGPVLSFVTNDFLTVVNPPDLGNTGAFIIRFLTRAADTEATLMNHQTGSDRFNLNLSNVGAGTISWGLAASSSSFSWTYAANTWYTLALLWDNGNMSLVLDGHTVLGTDTYTGTVKTDNETWHIGILDDLATWPLDGKISYIRCFNRPVSINKLIRIIDDPWQAWQEDAIALWVAAQGAPTAGLAGMYYRTLLQGVV